MLFKYRGFRDERTNEANEDYYRYCFNKKISVIIAEYC